MLWSVMSAANRPREIIAELQRRSIQLGAGVHPGEQLQGSIYFPYTHSPQKVLISLIAILSHAEEFAGES